MRRLVARLASITALTMLGAVPAQAAPPVCDGPPGPGVAGQRIKAPGNATVYLVDPEGKRRRIPNADFYLGLFRDWNGIITTDQVPCVQSGADLDPVLNRLVQPFGGAAVYFVDKVTNSTGITTQARWIVSASVFDKYYFRWDAIEGVTQDWLNGRLGPNWT